MILKKLRQEEKKKSRDLWEKVFDEDSKEFLDYYYEYKTRDNEILVIEKEGGIRSMLQLNPFELHCGTKDILSYYIVGVATETKYRRQGMMSELLTKSLREMYRDHIPFVFLMPADEKIYLPHHFRKIYDGELLETSLTPEEFHRIVNETRGKRVRLRIAEEADAKRMAQFAEMELAESYDIFTKRDWEYYERLLAEQKSEFGGILLAEKEGEICGMLLFDEEEGLGVRELITKYGEEHIFEEAGVPLAKKGVHKGMMMARIVCAEELFACMTCREGEEIDLTFVLADPVIRENTRIFSIRGNEEQVMVRCRPYMKERAEGLPMISIDALTTLIFGYEDFEKTEEAEQESFGDEFKTEFAHLRPLEYIFLNEVV